MIKIKAFVYNNKKKVLNLFIYLLGVFTLKGASIILTPLYTRVFTTSEYGTIELANSIVSFLGITIGLGLCQYLGIEYFHYEDKERVIAVVKNIKIYIMIVTPMVLAILLLNAFDLLPIIGLDKKIIILIMLSSYFVYFSNLCFMLCKNQQKTTLMTIIQLFTGIINLLLNLFGVCVLGWGIYSTFITSIITYVLLAGLIPKIYKFQGIRFKAITIKYGEVKQILNISTPLALTGLVNSILLLGDRWILNYYCSTAEIGIYSLAAKFGSIFELIIINTLTIFYAPYIYKLYQNMGMLFSEKENRRNFYLYMIISVICSIGFIVLIKWIFPILIDNRYMEAEKYLWIILIGEIFLGATYFRTYLINYRKKTRSILLINTMAMTFNLVANLFFIPKYQIWAAASTTTGAYVLMFLASTLINKKQYMEIMEKNEY